MASLLVLVTEKLAGAESAGACDCSLTYTCPAVTLMLQVCWTKYGAYPLHRPYCHEGAVRILLACLEAHANRHKRYIKPLLSVHMDFYVRVGQQLPAVLKRPCFLTSVVILLGWKPVSLSPILHTAV